MRTIVKILPTSGGSYVACHLDCGHVRQVLEGDQVVVGASLECKRCGEA